MINVTTPWTATVQSDIENSLSLYEMVLSGYTLNVFNTGDSLWLTAQREDAGKTAFRLAFGINAAFENVTINEILDGLLITAATRLGDYRINVSFPESAAMIVHYTTTFQAAFPILIPFWPRDIVPLTQRGKVENTAGTIHTHQVGSRSGQMFFSMTKPKKGSVFYFQNLTAMNPFCDATETSMAETVGGKWPEIGFRLPITKKPLPAGTEFTLSDAFVLLSDEIPRDDIDVARQFLTYITAIYCLLPPQETRYCDWQDISSKALQDLTFNKGCWTYAKGHAYLNAYLCDYKTPAEIMVQLSVLYAIKEHSDWSGEKYPVIKEIESGMQAFYDPKLKTLSRWLISQRSMLDNSEEQKNAMTMDSWYLHHPLLNLSKLALEGDNAAKKLLFDSLEYAVTVAHLFEYQWPVFYKMDTLEILKAETAPGEGGEKDVAGGYALLMINVWKITGDRRYLNEAIKAANKLAENGSAIFYQANTTAFSALAMLRLYKETKDESFLDTCYLCIAGIINNVQLWECEYGSGKAFVNFFGVFPLKDAPYKAAYEEMEVYAALNDFIKEAVTMNAPILPALHVLLPEFVKHSINRLSSYYPPVLPSDILSEDVKTGEVDPNLWIPIEDLYDGWDKHGQVGQEVYGAGVGFGVVPRQYVKIDENFLLYTDYPITKPKHNNRTSIVFTVLGDSRFTTRLLLLPIENEKLPTFKLTLNDGTKSQTVKPIRISGKAVEYKITGASKVRINWIK